MVLVDCLRPWLADKAPVRLLDIGCGTAVEAEPLLATGLIAEFVGVDLDESAVSLAQSHLPQATFVCADAAALDDSHHYNVILIRRPDLLAQPSSWQLVFAKLPDLLEPSGRIIVTVIGEQEAALSRQWLTANALPIIHTETLPLAEESYLLVADAPAIKAPSSFTLKTLDFAEGEGMYCDPLTGLCVMPDPLSEPENSHE